MADVWSSLPSIPGWGDDSLFEVPMSSHDFPRSSGYPTYERFFESVCGRPPTPPVSPPTLPTIDMSSFASPRENAMPISAPLSPIEHRGNDDSMDISLYSDEVLDIPEEMNTMAKAAAYVMRMAGGQPMTIRELAEEIRFWGRDYNINSLSGSLSHSPLFRTEYFPAEKCRKWVLNETSNE